MQIHDDTLRLDSERYERYRLYEEITDLGERLSLPIRNTPVLERIDGAVYGRDLDGRTRRMSDWAAESVRGAELDRAFDGANSVERTRRRLEEGEAIEVETLEHGEALVVFSPIPDAVRAGQTTIAGYRTDVARTFGRVYHRLDDKVYATSFSLEQSHKPSLVASAASIGMRLDDLQSEAILANRYRLTLAFDERELLVDRLITHYDVALRHATGQSTYAGNRLRDARDASTYIQAQPDLLREHLAELADLQRACVSPEDLAACAERLRRRTAAALDARLHDIAIASIGDGAVDTQLASRDYGGDCAIGVSAVSSAQEQLGLAQGKHRTNCPLCGTKGVTATVEGETITCSDCRSSVDICTGKVTQGKRRTTILPFEKPADHQLLTSVKRSFNRKVEGKSDIITQQYGRYAVVSSRVAICGMARQVSDRRTGQVLAQL